MESLFAKLCRYFLQQCFCAVILQGFQEFGNIFFRIHHTGFQSLGILLNCARKSGNFRFHRCIVKGKAVMRSSDSRVVILHEHIHNVFRIGDIPFLVKRCAELPAIGVIIAIIRRIKGSAHGSVNLIVANCSIMLAFNSVTD